MVWAQGLAGLWAACPHAATGEAMAYKVQEGMLAWLMHRIAGVGVFIFLLAHIADTAVIGWGPKPFNAVMAFYKRPMFLLLETALFGAVLFHALNGIRIIFLDFKRGATLHERGLFYAVLAVFLALFIPVAFLMLRPLFTG